MLELLAARNGATTARLNGKLLHSLHDPHREALRAVVDVAKREPPCVVVLGFGLGYQVEALLEKTDESVLLVYEPVEALIEEALAARDLRGVADSPRVVFTTTHERLNDALSKHGVSGFEAIRLESRYSAGDEEFAPAQQVVDAYRSQLDINRNTVNRFARLWVRNLCRNVPIVANAHPVACLELAHSGVPGLLLAAGPTLDQVVDHLPALAKRAVIVAVDTAVGTAIRAGVSPDYAVVVDPQYWNSRHLDRVAPPETLLVSESSAYPTVFASFSPPHFLCSSVFPLGRRLERVLGTFGALGAGGSVSTSAWDLLRRMGCSPIYVAGLDLGFPGGRTHCRDSFFEQLAVASGDRFRSAERVVHRYIWSAGPREVDSNDGGTVLTDKRMLIYQSWFESQLGVAGAGETLSITAGGVAIRGLHLCSRDALRTLPERRGEIDSQRRRTRAELPPTASRQEVLIAEIRALTDDLSDLESVAADAIARLSQIEGNYRAGTTVDFSSLEDVDQRIATHPAREEASFLMQSAISSIRGGHGSQSIAAQLEASRQLYESLLRSASYHAEQLRRLV